MYQESIIRMRAVREVERLRKETQKMASTWEHLSREADRAAELEELVYDLRAENEALRSYVAEVEAWKNKGMRLFSATDSIGSLTAFRAGAWWASRPRRS